jgi:5'-nucleotidase
LIDDRPKNGALEFGEHDEQEWIHFGSDEFPDWGAVLSYLEC